MTTISLKVLYPATDEKIILENVDLNHTVIFLKSEAAAKLNWPENDIDLLFLGSLLDDKTIIKELDLSHISLIYIILKAKQEPIRKFKPVCEGQLQAIARKFSVFHASDYRKIVKPEAINKIVDSFPEFRDDLVAFTTLKYPILLLSSMQHIESLEKYNQHHPVLIAAADLIFITIKEMAYMRPIGTVSMQTDELSDSSSSSDNGGPSTSHDITGRPITRDQLSAALARTFYSPNYVPRTLSFPNRDDTATNSDPTSEFTPSTSGSQLNRITPTMFTNALSQALEASQNQARPAGATAASIVPPIITSSPVEAPDEIRYARELQQMREIGLFDEHDNIQALLLCNGDVDAAINLLFSGAIA